MNKSDIKLLIILIIIVFSLLIGLFFSRSNNAKNALVYYEDELVLTINLSQKKQYEVDGELGKVLIEASDGKVRVIKENSPNHICSKQGYISESYQVLVCLPNKVVIKIEEKENIDTVAK